MTKRTAAHIKAQRAGRERDLNTCQKCGSRKQVEGHHIIDLQFTGAAIVDNIISLCHICHTEVHKGEISLNKF